MKRFYSLSIFAILIFSIKASATDYYSGGNNAPNLTSSWWTNTNGTGSHPANFTTAGNRFIIQSSHTMTTTANWTVSGAGSSVEVNGTLVANNTVTIPSASVFNSGGRFNLNVSGGNVPTATWDVSSTVAILIWSSSSNTPTNLVGQIFGNFNLGPFSNGGGNTGALSTASGTITCAGNFTVDIGGANGRPIALGTGAGDNVTLNVGGNFTITSGTFNIGTNTGNCTLNIGGNFSQASGTTLTESGTGSSSMVFDGSSAQSITESGTLSGTINQTINNISSTGVTLLSAYTIPAGCSLTMTDGNIYTTSSNLLTFSDNATASGASNASYVDGPVKKVGNDAFTFPVGSGGGYHAISISAPGVTTDAFSAQFFRGSAYNLAGIDPLSGIQAISQCEYWDLSRTAGSSNVDVTIGWTTSSPCGGGTSYVNNPPLGLTIGWLDTSPNPDLWKKATGGGGTTITGTGGVGGSGTVKQTGVTSYGNFVLASNLVGGSPLPVKLGIFRVYQKQSGVQIDWTTFSEMNVSHFEIERSSDGISFATIGQVTAKNFIAGSAYNWFDAAPLSGNNFYRIRTVDIDNKIEVSSIVRINLNKSTDGGISIYPNPVTGGRISFQASDMQQGVYNISIYDNAGRRLYMQSFTHSGGAVSQSIQLPSSMKPGMYTIQFLSGDSKISKPFIVQ